MSGLDISVSFLTFGGGAILSWDAFRSTAHLYEDQGTAILLEIQKAGGFTFRDDSKKPLNEGSYKLRVARRTALRATIGFALVTAGFALDLVSKILH